MLLGRTQMEYHHHAMVFGIDPIQSGAKCSTEPPMPEPRHAKHAL